ncbi:MAG: crossover junction endodeoxyribonuclease RuvC [Gammaproteobacteria bacterium]|nr:crossover junction endodeoxyribonuclease RuvC [Gammaproteobacteria bacterium]
MSASVRIMGVDPGSRFTGWGIIRSDGAESHYVASGCITLPPRRPMGERLTRIYKELGEIARCHRVEEAALETVFMHRNVQSALKLGQARGAALCALVMAGVGEAAEYSPRRVKQAVCGYGGAGKEQVALMVARLLDHDGDFGEDEADGLALGICHAHHLGVARLAARAREAGAEAVS